MVVGLILIALFVGAVSAGITLVLGGSLLVALMVYSGMGSLSLLVLAALIGLRDSLPASGRALETCQAGQNMTPPAR